MGHVAQDAEVKLEVAAEAREKLAKWHMALSS